MYQVRSEFVDKASKTKHKAQIKIAMHRQVTNCQSLSLTGSRDRAARRANQRALDAMIGKSVNQMQHLARTTV
jgi:hypothetical protein